MGNEEFVVAVPDLEYKAFVVQIAALSIDSVDEVHPSQRTQIAYLKADAGPIKVLSKYANILDIFSPKLVVELPKYTRINNHTIKLINDWQLPYVPIYSLGLVELEILKTYIKNNLANGFIRPSKSPTEILILFNKKSNRSLRLYIDYCELNNLTIKN